LTVAWVFTNLPSNISLIFRHHKILLIWHKDTYKIVRFLKKFTVKRLISRLTRNFPNFCLEIILLTWSWLEWLHTTNIEQVSILIFVAYLCHLIILWVLLLANHLFWWLSYRHITLIKLLLHLSSLHQIHIHKLVVKLLLLLNLLLRLLVYIQGVCHLCLILKEIVGFLGIEVTFWCFSVWNLLTSYERLSYIKFSLSLHLSLGMIVLL